MPLQIEIGCLMHIICSMFRLLFTLLSAMFVTQKMLKTLSKTGYCDVMHQGDHLGGSGGAGRQQAW